MSQWVAALVACSMPYPSANKMGSKIWDLLVSTIAASHKTVIRNQRYGWSTRAKMTSNIPKFAITSIDVEKVYGKMVGSSSTDSRRAGKMMKTE